MKHGGTVRLHNLKWVERSNGDLVAVSRSSALSIADEHGREREMVQVTVWCCDQRSRRRNSRCRCCSRKWDPHTHPIIADRAGIVRYQAFEDGITVKRQVDELTGLANYFGHR